VRPARRWTAVLAALALLGVVAAFRPAAAMLWHVAAVVIAVVGVVDGVRVSWGTPLKVSRRIHHYLAVDRWVEVRLTVTNHTSGRFTGEVFDLLPPCCQWRGLPAVVQLDPGEMATVCYHARPCRRGEWQFRGVEVLRHSPWRLWKRLERVDVCDTVRVYPDYVAVMNYALLARTNQLGVLGVRRRPRRGEGMAFHQLREYRSGDTLRQIDWKATASHRRLISREYQEERDQTVVFLLDCSARMRAHDPGVVHFDQVLKSMLLLAYVALRQGDSVGMMTFGGWSRWLAPRKGQSTVTELLNNIYDVHASNHAADYLQAARQLHQRQRKRALVVLLTNTRDDDEGDLVAALELLSRRHFVLFANLREVSLDTLRECPIHTLDDGLTYLAAEQFLWRRHCTHETILKSGVSVLDVTAARLPIAVVNRYLDIKKGGRL